MTLAVSHETTYSRPMTKARVRKPKRFTAEEIAAKDAVSPKRVEWRMNRIAAKANGSIRRLSYFRAAFPDFLKREQFELIDHLTQYGANLCRQNHSLGIPELIEEMKCEAAEIGFHDYSDAVSIALKNLRRGI